MIDMILEAINASKDEAPDLHGALIRQRQAQMRADELQRSDDMRRRRTFREVLEEAQTYVGAGGGGGNASPSQAPPGPGSNERGGLSGVCGAYTCRCGQPATRFHFGCRPVCRACPAEEPHDAHVRARAAQPVPAPPERRYCPCGQELRTAQRAEMADSRVCGDCFMQGGGSAFRHTPPHWALPDRIAAAQKSDADPTQAWGAGATPSYDWEGT